MMFCIKFVIILIVASVSYADEISKIQPGGPMIAVDPILVDPIPVDPIPVDPLPVASSSPKWPPPCCSSRFGCDAKTLAQYCLPLPCPGRCISSASCSCIFPGTKVIIHPKKATPVPRPPFCSNVVNHPCPMYMCTTFKCPSQPIECTASQIQNMINLQM